MMYGIPLILGLGARIRDPYVYVVIWAPLINGRVLFAFCLAALDFQCCSQPMT